ncbi:Zinc knuckle CX2CX4HX4C, partial [Sesbania bispinosa]
MNSIQNALSGIWCNPKGFKVEELRNKVFQFFFDEESDANRILQGSPWLFRNSWLILKGWERGIEIDDVGLATTLDRGSFVKVLVEMNINHPLKAGINVGSNKDGIHWIDFQYEKLPQFCYSCGLVGHAEEFCSNKNDQEANGESEDKLVGPWLRASQFGRRIPSVGPTR